MAELSIIILSFNTKEVLSNCLESLEKVKTEVDFEIIVVDNASTDGSSQMVADKFPKVKLVQNKENLGFAAGNNAARNFVNAKTVLFLNSDTLVKQDTIKQTLSYLNSHPEVGAITCRTLLKNGSDDKDARRSFPTPWVAFTHFSHLDRLFPKSKLFSQYWCGYKNPSEIQEIDVLQGAFAMISKKTLDEIKWFDESYFLDGEDIDLCWKIKKKGLKIIYYPVVSITHLKGVSKGKNKSAKRDFNTKLKSVTSGLNSMEIFYRKHLWNKYPLIINIAVLAGINFLKSVRLIKLVLS